MTACTFFRLDLVIHINPCLKRSYGRSSSCVRQISQRSFGPWYALQKSRTYCAGTIESKLLKMKRTGRCPLSFLRMLRQSMEKMSKPTSQLARCSTMYRNGRSRNRGTWTFLVAILSTTPLSDLKGESKIKALTQYAQVLANIIAQRLPILLPQIVILPTFTCFLTYYSMSRMSNTSFTPQLSSAASLFPQPKRSKAVRLKPN